MRGVSISAEINGQQMSSLRELALRVGLPQRTIHYRWMRGKRGAQLLAPPRHKSRQKVPAERALLLLQQRNVVYFLKAGPFIKIGYTRGSVRSRVEHLKTGCPYGIEPLATIGGDHETEYELHQRFAHHRANLEWFHAADEIMSFISERRA